MLGTYAVCEASIGEQWWRMEHVSVCDRVWLMGHRRGFAKKEGEMKIFHSGSSSFFFAFNFSIKQFHRRLRGEASTRHNGANRDRLTAEISQFLDNHLFSIRRGGLSGSPSHQTFVGGPPHYVSAPTADVISSLRFSSPFPILLVCFMPSRPHQSSPKTPE